jgi:hypothetical protein
MIINFVFDRFKRSFKFNDRVQLFVKLNKKFLFETRLKYDMANLFGTPELLLNT